MISIIVCTYNRSEIICNVINSLLDQTLPISDYEILVVDNGSQDNTKSLVLEKYGGISNVRYIFEPESGLSKARNKGINEALGEFLVFIDDDAIACRDWLENLISIYRTYPDAQMVGGKINLLWECVIPNWLHTDLLGYLGRLDYGNTIKQVIFPDRLGGGNFSIKRETLMEVGFFSPRLGRNRFNLLSGEEVELMRRVQEKTGKCYYSPQAVVMHIVPIERLIKTFFVHRSYWQGYSVSIQRYMEVNRQAVSLTLYFSFLKLLVRCGGYLGLYIFFFLLNRLRRQLMIFSELGNLKHVVDHLRRRCICYQVDEAIKPK